MATLEEEVSKVQLFKEVQFSLCEDVIQFENVMKLSFYLNILLTDDLMFR